MQRGRLYSSVLSSGDGKSNDSSCSDDYASDSFCSEILESDWSSREEPDTYVSDENDKEVEEPFRKHDTDKR
ncbi:hypothetical protein PR003_g18982 [Phytophthora rubi]|uniref:Uncharacterized protein n=1 Tax=Phytophthora rubi TaxID=129364 RepID=A0A6A3JYE9_9STRA|nr:hypothetical protein PR002_g18327 [Phytophthora rubi]KAE9033440.1 hypothetical protein PR001_g10161 [Phytophthora rubi]KAE9315462.1 hypothetical protein PR003_g18982 [Phytophthora rubi]